MKQVDKLYEYLKQHGSITGMECMTELGILNYKGRIHDLRSLGVKIVAVRNQTPNAEGEVKPYRRYYLA
jgi:hypothetical protein